MPRDTSFGSYPSGTSWPAPQHTRRRLKGLASAGLHSRQNASPIRTGPISHDWQYASEAESARAHGYAGVVPRSSAVRGRCLFGAVPLPRLSACTPPAAAGPVVPSLTSGCRPPPAASSAAPAVRGVGGSAATSQAPGAMQMDQPHHPSIRSSLSIARAALACTTLTNTIGASGATPIG